MPGDRKIGNLWLLHFLTDFLAITVSYYTALLVRFRSVWGEGFFTALNRLLGVRDTGLLGRELEAFYWESAPRIILFLTATLFVLYALCNLYSGRRFVRKRPVAWNIIVANVTALMLFYAYFYLRRNVFHPRSFFATLLGLNAVYCMAFRGAVDRVLEFARSSLGIDRCSAVLIGRGGEADFLSVLIGELHPHGVYVAARVEYSPDESFTELIARVRDASREHRAEMIISAEKRLSVTQIMQLLELAEELDVAAKVLSDELDVLMKQAHLPVDTIRGIPLVHFDKPSTGRRFAGSRRAVVMLLAAVMLVVASPLMCLVSVLIKLTSRGPVFFTQERIGVNRKPFLMYKFRTMYERADELLAQVEEFNETGGGGLFKIRKDPRVTPIGRFLRRFSLDELPQLTNVMQGEMMIVGPRPVPRRDFEHYYEDWHYSRHSGMPGLTCLWQVSGRSDLNFHNMCILDVFYLRNRNWVLDLKILLKTFWVVLFAKGAY